MRTKRRVCFKFCFTFKASKSESDLKSKCPGLWHTIRVENEIQHRLFSPSPIRNSWREPSGSNPSLIPLNVIETILFDAIEGKAFMKECIQGNISKPRLVFLRSFRRWEKFFSKKIISSRKNLEMFVGSPLVRRLILVFSSTRENHSRPRYRPCKIEQVSKKGTINTVNFDLL